MKKTIPLIIILFFIPGLLSSLAQTSVKTNPPGRDGPETYLDFWVGCWEVTWDEGNGTVGRGVNEVSKILDGTVIQERFRILQGKGKGFKGTSISVYQPRLKRWKQAWADNQGGYFDFIGQFGENQRIFQTGPIQKDGKQMILRMVFKDIEKTSFLWDWESSEDGGKNWKLNWRIQYKQLDMKDFPG